MTTATRTRPRAQVGRGTRRALLVAHIVASGAWIGIDVVLGVLVFTALSADPAAAALCLQVLPLLFWPVLIAGLVSLVTGIALGLGTRYGLLRYWWVAVKLVINLVLVVLVALVLRGGLDEAAVRGAAGGPDAVEGLDTLAFPPVVSITLLVTATVLAVVKPWGRIRRSA
ncbi:hypothetical protein [Pseudonocardia alaniniphila]|uniref:DUF2269 domain-containing protein n=1 Tax=Pseudonocardia alaniniphila TaxID=75291 RepID=A0ABS9TBL0_9PSEU|nr:hypothetical protein [Pseudonocardia alaniniphila]MCH6165773.1 hypothetical protein [Pseudonocardia alaniniphila]